MPNWWHTQGIKFQVSRGNCWHPLRASLCLCIKFSVHYALNNCFMFSRMYWVYVINCFLFRRKRTFSQHFTMCPSPFCSQSSVMSVCFARFHPNLVVGGTYSGQIVLWDNRSHRRTPVQRTPLSAAAHTVSQAFVTSLLAIQALKGGIIDKSTRLSLTLS